MVLKYPYLTLLTSFFVVAFIGKLILIIVFLERIFLGSSSYKNPSFSLIWSRLLSPHDRCDINAICQRFVRNLDIDNLFLTFDRLNLYNLYNLGVCYENLFASSLAVKYYLWRLLNPNTEFAYFDQLYDFSSDETNSTRELLKDIKVNFSTGIHFPDNESFVFHSDFRHAIIHNKNAHNAHHDIILPVLWNEIQEKVAVSAKASFALKIAQILAQSQVSKDRSEQVSLLVWLYLGEMESQSDHPNVAFLNGSGVCNGPAFELLMMMKKLKSESAIEK